jgi:hypothetical protein
LFQPLQLSLSFTVKNLYDAPRISELVEAEAVIPRLAQILILTLLLCSMRAQAAALFRPEECGRLVAHWSADKADRWLKAERFPRLSHEQQKVLAERLSKARLIRRQIIDIDNDAEAVDSIRRKYDAVLTAELRKIPKLITDRIRLDFAIRAADRDLADIVSQMRQLSEPTRLLAYFPAGVPITRPRLELLLETFAVETHMLWYLHDFYKALGIIEARDQMDGVRRSSRWRILAAARYAAGLPNDSFDENLPWVGRSRETRGHGPSSFASSLPELEVWNEQSEEIHFGPLYLQPSDAVKELAAVQEARGSWVPVPVNQFLDEYLEAVNVYQLRPIQALGAMAHELQEWASPSDDVVTRLRRGWLADELPSSQAAKDKDEDEDYVHPE